MTVPSKSDDATCRGCGAALGEDHRPECPYKHPWPHEKVDRVQTRIEPVTTNAEQDARLRSEFGIVAIRARGVLMHPECRTKEERTMTVQFVKQSVGCCERCQQTLAKAPSV